MGGTETRFPVGGGLSPSGVARWGAVVSGDVEEGVGEEVSDAFPQAGCLDQGDRPDALGGARGVEAQLPESPEVLPTAAGLCRAWGSAGAAAGGAGCDGKGGVGWGGWSSLSRVGSGDGVSCGGRGRGDSRWSVSAGVSTSIGWSWLPCVACVAWSPGGGWGGWCGGGTVGGRGSGGGCCAGWGLSALVGRVGVACVRRAVLAVPGWLWCHGVGGRRPHGRPGGAVVRMLWVAVGGWCSLVWVVGGGAAGGGGALLLGPGVAGVRVRLPAGPWGCTLARVLWARVVGTAGGARPPVGGFEGVLVVCGTPALVGVVVGAGGRGICDGVVR